VSYRSIGRVGELLKHGDGRLVGVDYEIGLFGRSGPIARGGFLFGGLAERFARSWHHRQLRRRHVGWPQPGSSVDRLHRP